MLRLGDATWGFHDDRAAPENTEKNRSKLENNEEQCLRTEHIAVNDSLPLGF